MPAAIDTSSAPRRSRSAANALQTSLITCGLTASTITLALLAMSLLLPVHIPQSWLSSLSLLSSKSLAQIFSGLVPLAIRPRMRPLAMFPAPIKPIVVLFKISPWLGSKCYCCLESGCRTASHSNVFSQGRITSLLGCEHSEGC